MASHEEPDSYQPTGPIVALEEKWFLDHLRIPSRMRGDLQCHAQDLPLNCQFSIISSLVSNSCPHWTQRIQSDSTNGSSSRIPIPPQSGHRAKCTF